MKLLKHLVGMIILTAVLVAIGTILIRLLMYLAVFVVVCFIWTIGYLVLKLQEFLWKSNPKE